VLIGIVLGGAKISKRRTGIVFNFTRPISEKSYFDQLRKILEGPSTEIYLGKVGSEESTLSLQMVFRGIDFFLFLFSPQRGRIEISAEVFEKRFFNHITLTHWISCSGRPVKRKGLLLSSLFFSRENAEASISSLEKYFHLRCSLVRKRMMKGSI